MAALLYLKGVFRMKFFICVGHAYYKNGDISSADGSEYGGVNEYKYNKALAPYVVKWLKEAGHEAVLCIAPEKKYSCLQDEVNYFIGEENKGNYDIAVQLHLNASEKHNADGCEAYAYNEAGKKVAAAVCSKLEKVWDNRGAKISTGLYWTRKTKAKAVLIESFFCDNKEDYEKAKELGYDAHGKMIAEGLIGKDIVVKTENKVESGAIKYYVQAGAFKSKESAQKMVDKLKKAGFDAIIKTE